MSEQYRWAAWYGPGDALEEDDAPYSWLSVEQDRLRELILEPLDPGLHRVVVQRRDGEELIFRRERHHPVNLATGERLMPYSLTRVGIRTPGGEWVYLHLLPSGDAVLTTRSDLNGE